MNSQGWLPLGLTFDLLAVQGTLKIPHTREQLSLRTTTAEPVRLEPGVRSGRSPCEEKPAHRSEELPLLAATGESLHKARKTYAAKTIN